jgi:RNA polymerase sigma factor (sigma-70 family)
MTMSARHLAPAFRHLRRLLARPDPGGTSDAQLLQRFVGQRDESAFELLVWRHGPMVHGVCRRVLRDGHDADDAFQATLLVLARKAGSISRRESLAGWLYKVAYRVALRARDGAARRARHERQVGQVPPVADPRPAAGPDELHAVLDEELNRLPPKQRAPVVLCYLEGLTNEEAARQLRCPVGTVKTRLAQARRSLARRLARRGLTPAGGLLATAGPELPAGLVGETVRAAALAAAGKVSAACVSAQVACLTEGVLRAMMVTRVKLAAVAVAVGLALAAGGTASYRALGGEPAGQRGEAEVAPPKPTPAEVRAKRLKKEIGELTEQLRKAEEEVAKEKAVPPRQGPVAVIYGSVPITREELAEHLLSRLSAKQLEGYVTRRILEHACKKEGITVTQEEVDAYLKEHLGRANLKEQMFRAQLHEQRKMTLREWKEDVIRPQLLLQKLARAARVTEKALRAEYEARYGQKVECQFLVWQVGQWDEADRAAELLRSGKATFEDLLRRNPRGNHVITIGRDGVKERKALEKAAFALEPGEVSPVIDIPQGFVVLKCLRRLPAEPRRFEDVRESLKREVEGRLKGGDTAKLLEELKAEARAKLFWTPPNDREGGGR